MRVEATAEVCWKGAGTRGEVALAGRYNRSYTLVMKTAISIPDEVFEAAERIAARKNMSRSQLYSQAVADWVERHRDDRVTEALDAVYGVDEEAGKLDAEVEALQLRSIRRQR